MHPSFVDLASIASDELGRLVARWVLSRAPLLPGRPTVLTSTWTMRPGQRATRRPAVRLVDPSRSMSRRRLSSRGDYGEPVMDRRVIDELRDFVAERDWAQFHTPENLAKSISIEAAELLECFQWGPGADEDKLRDELADVLTYCLLLADRLGVDPGEVVLGKLAQTRQKYPADKARGRSAKYDEL